MTISSSTAFFTLSFSLIVCGSVLVPSSALSNPRVSQQGSIELEQEEKTADSYSTSVAQTLAFASAVKSTAHALSAGTTAPSIPTLSEGSFKYLASAYLYCSSNRGVCPHILDLVLESDLIEAKRGSKSGCPITEKFWSTWLASDMEKRQQFMVKTAHINESAEFKRSLRPRYIKCQSTIKTELEGDGSTTDFFKKRYNSEKPLLASIDKGEEELRDISAKVPHLYSALGLN